MVGKECILGELTLAREEALKIGPQEVPPELRVDAHVEELENGVYKNFIHGIHFHITTKDDILRDIKEVCVHVDWLPYLCVVGHSWDGGQFSVIF